MPSLPWDRGCVIVYTPRCFSSHLVQGGDAKVITDAIGSKVFFGAKAWFVILYPRLYCRQTGYHAFAQSNHCGFCRAMDAVCERPCKGHHDSQRCHHNVFLWQVGQRPAIVSRIKDINCENFQQQEQCLLKMFFLLLSNRFVCFPCEAFFQLCLSMEKLQHLPKQTHWLGFPQPVVPQCNNSFAPPLEEIDFCLISWMPNGTGSENPQLWLRAGPGVWSFTVCPGGPTTNFHVQPSRLESFFLQKAWLWAKFKWEFLWVFKLLRNFFLNPLSAFSSMRTNSSTQVLIQCQVRKGIGSQLVVRYVSTISGR